MKRIGLNIYTEKDKSGQYKEMVIKAIKKVFKDCDISLFEDSEIKDDPVLDELEMMITLGGDGTIIRTARALCNKTVPILGVNIGNLGFLASIESQQMEEAFSKIKAGEYDVEERIMLSCSLTEEGNLQTYHSLNDIVISKGALARMAKYEIRVDNNIYTQFSADGIIISTPTGSTAYGLSAGGPIIYPTLSLIELTPICPHSPGLRTIVLDSKSKVTIFLKEWHESIFLTIDGQESIRLNGCSGIDVSLSPWKSRLIRLKDYDYFKVLREKIIWRTRECEGE